MSFQLIPRRPPLPPLPFFFHPPPPPLSPSSPPSLAPAAPLNVLYLHGLASRVFGDAADPSLYVESPLPPSLPPAAASALSGAKVTSLYSHCLSRGLSFSTFELRGHTPSLPTPLYEVRSLGEWIEDGCAALEEASRRALHATAPPSSSSAPTDVDPPAKSILVGSSLGAWLALHLALRRSVSA
jgi:hypothetical protein